MEDAPGRGKDALYVGPGIEYPAAVQNGFPSTEINTFYKLAGYDVPGPVVIQGDAVWLYFKTDESQALSGWSLSWQAGRLINLTFFCLLVGVYMGLVFMKTVFPGWKTNELHQKYETGGRKNTKDITIIGTLTCKTTRHNGIMVCIVNLKMVMKLLQSSSMVQSRVAYTMDLYVGFKSEGSQTQEFAKSL